MRVPFSSPDAAINFECFICQALRMCKVTQEESRLPYGARARLPGMSDDHCIVIGGPEKDSAGLCPVGG
jgi:hypothetical protein